MNKELNGDPCPECKGSGKVSAYTGGLYGGGSVDADCFVCAGTGKVNIQGVCKHCKGCGKVLDDDDTKLIVNYDPRETCPHCNGSGLEPL